MNYVDLFRATLPETVLEIAALLVIVVDLGFLRKAANKARIGVAAVFGVAGCAAAIWAVYAAGWGSLSNGSYVVLAVGGSAAVAQIAILVLTALTLLLLVDSEFTRNPGEYVSVVLMAAAGGCSFPQPRICSSSSSAWSFSRSASTSSPPSQAIRQER